VASLCGGHSDPERIKRHARGEKNGSKGAEETEGAGGIACLNCQIAYILTMDEQPTSNVWRNYCPSVPSSPSVPFVAFDPVFDPAFQSKIVAS
jgi:hypothetical protein